MGRVREVSVDMIVRCGLYAPLPSLPTASKFQDGLSQLALKTWQLVWLADMYSIICWLLKVSPLCKPVVSYLSPLSIISCLSSSCVTGSLPRACIATARHFWESVAASFSSCFLDKTTMYIYFNIMQNYRGKILSVNRKYIFMYNISAWWLLIYFSTLSKINFKISSPAVTVCISGHNRAWPFKLFLGSVSWQCTV